MKIQGAVARGRCKIQQSAGTSEGFPPASCCERLLPKTHFQVRPLRRRRRRADLETQTEKRRRPRHRAAPVILIRRAPAAPAVGTLRREPIETAGRGVVPVAGIC